MQPPNNQELPELTKQDLRKIEKSMRKPEFMGLLNEYMVEISDPKNKKEYDEWLKQMEKEGELPKHMQLVQPRAEFCVKTTLTSARNKQQEMKFFVNMCSAKEINPPNFEPFTNDKGEVGQNWRVPNSMGKVRYDQDKKGNVCNTVDAVFHPDAFLLGQNKSFQAMMINIALDTAQKQLGQRKETISKDYVVLQNVKCKGDEPALLPVRRVDGKIVSKGEGEPERSMEGRQTNLQRQINQKKEQHEKEQEEKRKQKQQEEQDMRRLDEELKEESKPADDSKGPARPKYQAIYSYALDYGDFIDKKVDRRRKVPKTYALEFKLPKLENFSEIKVLDVNDSKLVLEAGEKYFIDLDFAELKLSFKLLTAESKAKFDKKKKTLRITFPIDPSSIVQEPQPAYEPKVAEEDVAEEVQDETWKDKNKLLEITQNKVATQFLQPVQEPEQPAKKFVQEIDEDDEATSKEQAPIANAIRVKKQPVAAPVSTKPITYKFQETAKECFVIIHLPKYRKEDVEVFVHEQKILVKWNRQQVPDYFELRLARSDFTKHEIRLIVEYAVVKFEKAVSGFWQASSVTIAEDTPEVIEAQIQGIKEVAAKPTQQIEEVRELKQQPQLPPHQERTEMQAIEVRETKESTTAASQPALPVEFKPAARTLQFLSLKISLSEQLD